MQGGLSIDVLGIWYTSLDIGSEPVPFNALDAPLFFPFSITYPSDSGGIDKQPQEGGNNKIYFALALGTAGLY